MHCPPRNSDTKASGKKEFFTTSQASKVARPQACVFDSTFGAMETPSRSVNVIRFQSEQTPPLEDCQTNAATKYTLTGLGLRAD
jgi:hypothetical protein